LHISYGNYITIGGLWQPTKQQKRLKFHHQQAEFQKRKPAEIIPQAFIP